MQGELYVKSDEHLAKIFTKGLAYPRLMHLKHRVRGVYDVYAITDCDSVVQLLESDCDYIHYC